MNNFSIKELKNKTVGDFLKDTRAEIQISLEKVSQKTRINIKYLKALEEGGYDELPGGVYSEKILESYASYLNIDYACLKKAFRRESGFVSKKIKRTFVPKISSRSLLVTPRLISIAFVFLLVVFLLIYLGTEINNIFSPPNLIVSSPPDNFITEKPTIKVSGQTEEEVDIKINDQNITDPVRKNHGSWKIIYLLANAFRKIRLKRSMNIILKPRLHWAKL